MMQTIIAPFIDASVNVLEKEAKYKITTGSVEQENGALVSNDITVMIGVSGRLEGQVFYSMPFDTARSMLSKMMGEVLEEFDELAQSGIAELSNVITGRAFANLETAGYSCNISSPIVFMEQGASLRSITQKRTRIPFISDHGELSLYVDLREAEHDDD